MSEDLKYPPVNSTQFSIWRNFDSKICHEEMIVACSWTTSDPFYFYIYFFSIKAFWFIALVVYFN